MNEVTYKPGEVIKGLESFPATGWFRSWVWTVGEPFPVFDIQACIEKWDERCSLKIKEGKYYLIHVDPMGGGEDHGISSEQALELIEKLGLIKEDSIWRSKKGWDWFKTEKEKREKAKQNWEAVSKDAEGNLLPRDEAVINFLNKNE